MDLSFECRSKPLVYQGKALNVPAALQGQLESFQNENRRKMKKKTCFLFFPISSSIFNLKAF